MCCEKGLLDNGTAGECDNDIAILDLLSGASSDDLVSHGDFLSDEVVDEFAKCGLGAQFGGGWVDRGDSQLQCTNRIALTDREGSAGREVGDLVREVGG